jgi:hypothetical protein
MISSDIQLLDFPSLLRGTMFVGEPRSLPLVLRSPLISTPVNYLYAWALPFCNATSYWMFTMLVANANSYFNTPFIEPPADERLS